MNNEEISKYSELIDFIIERFDKAQISFNSTKDEVIITIKKCPYKFADSGHLINRQEI